MAGIAKKFICEPNDVAIEFIEGLTKVYPGLQYLDGFPQIKVVLRADVLGANYDKVAVISGGGSGHEPAHAGFVGAGMLTAAICGDVFTPPPADSVLAGIRAVTGPKGCLLIVQNYADDRHNFGLAAEKAKSEGYIVEMVIVEDDCAFPPLCGMVSRRGLAGTILVHKIAGAAAESGMLLSDVAAEANRALKMVGTIGVALSACTLPGQVISDRIGPGFMEFGIGIHGEPGATVTELQPVDAVVSRVLCEILSEETQFLSIKRGSRVVLMVNGLGATPIMELMIATRKAISVLQLVHGLAVDRVYTGSFMTSLDMAGLSISVMEADQAILQHLDVPTKAPYWPVGTEGDHPPAKIQVPKPNSHSTNVEMHHDWTDVGRYMDDYVFSLVLDNLPLPELLRVASVCKSWRIAQRMHRKIYASSQLYTGRRFPMLVFSRDPTVPEAENLIYDPMRKSYYAIPLPDPDLLFCGAMLGWIFLIRRGVQQTQVIILNPFSLRQIVVTIPYVLEDPMILLTRPPTDNNSILFLWSAQCIFIRNVADGPLFLKTVKKNTLSALPVLVGETVSTNAGVDGGYSGGEKMLVIDLSAQKVTNNVMTFSAQMQLPHRVFFAEWSGQIYLLKMILRMRGEIRFEVYQGNMNSMIWERLSSLGAVAIFISCNNNLSHSHCFAMENNRYIKRNTIYCTGALFLKASVQECLYIEYDYNSHQVKYITGPGPVGTTKWFCQWMVPSYD